MAKYTDKYLASKNKKEMSYHDRKRKDINEHVNCNIYNTYNHLSFFHECKTHQEHQPCMTTPTNTISTAKVLNITIYITQEDMHV